MTTEELAEAYGSAMMLGLRNAASQGLVPDPLLAICLAIQERLGDLAKEPALAPALVQTMADLGALARDAQATQLQLAQQQREQILSQLQRGD